MTHSEVKLGKLEPTVSILIILYESSMGTSGLKERGSLRKLYIKDMNDEIKLTCCNYVNIYVNMLRNEDFKEFLFKETVTSDLRCKFTSKLIILYYI